MCSVFANSNYPKDHTVAAPMIPGKPDAGCNGWLLDGTDQG